MSKNRITKVPIEPKERYVSAVFSGSISAKTFEPSRGGMGIRLNMARRTLSLISVPIIKPKKEESIISESGILGKAIQAMIEARTASRTFVKGPARETSAISFLPSLKLKGSTGTGFAPPKMIGEPEIMSMRGNRTLMNGSI